jgi:hypothetical protein
MTGSPEFKAAVAEAAAEAIKGLLPQLNAARVDAGSAPQAGDRDFAVMLSEAIAALTDQGSGIKRVPADVMVARTKARERMVNLIIEARAENKPATYTLRNKVVINERIIEPFWVSSDHKTHATEIDFGGVPNEAMVPVNDTAKEIFRAFKESIGTTQGGKGRDGHPLPGDDSLGVTRGGLVVRNSAVSVTMAQKSTPERPAWNGDGPMPAYEDAPQVNGGPNYEPLRVHNDAEKGQYKNVSVLGTIQPPARQST